MVLVAALAYDESTLFPGYAAALPVVGSALLLVGGLRAASWGPQAGLSLPPVRADRRLVVLPVPLALAAADLRRGGVG